MSRKAAVAEQDVRWGRAGIRARIVYGLEHFAREPAHRTVLPQLTRGAAGLAAALRRQWPDDCAMEVYPAFVDRS
ncbi:MAG: hypothetical protein AAF602_09330 [Myxococcota bacterium]